MTRNEILFFGFVIVFFGLIWLVEVFVERILYVWLTRLKILRLWLIIFILLFIIGMLVAPELTRQAVKLMISMGILMFQMLIGAVQGGLEATK